ncbi:hypothetical protein AWH48_00845 [Domibacillus aminovorans]|uniref:Uncharacterized protein n=1 Tax=Domibacillus aminovorans TaxID=29332 RepID=A0A177L2K9_9BACI|nr:hypothetical protein AWH48_00845 [Domibacillus aminovorans]
MDKADKVDSMGMDMEDTEKMGKMGKTGTRVVLVFVWDDNTAAVLLLHPLNNYLRLMTRILLLIVNFAHPK